MSAKDVTLQGSLFDGWHERGRPWRVTGTEHTVEPEDDDGFGPFRITRPAKPKTFTFTIERTRDDGTTQSQTVETSAGYVVVDDPPTLLIVFPLEST